jgi:enoyl-CoA hydratase/carnithine racemase
MDLQNVRVEVADKVAVVTLDRPPVNALDSETWRDLAVAFDSLGARRDVNVAIFNAAGKVFCAGVDLVDSPRRHRPDGRPEDGAPQGDPRDQLDSGLIVRQAFWALYDCAVPVIGAIDGKAIGAGAVLVSLCDMVVATPRFEVALTEVNVGVLGGVKATQRMVGPYMAKRMFLTGEYVGADELYRRGVLEAVVEPDELMPRARALAEVIAAKSPIAVRLAKESANRVEDMDLKEGYRTEQDYTIRVKRHADSNEAGKAFAERRDPEFRWE